MDDILLLKISLTLSIIGIFSLFVLSKNISEPEQPLNRDVVLQGYITSLQNHTKYTLISLTTPIEEKVIVFKNIYQLKKSDFLEIHGTREKDTIYATDIYKLKK